MNVTFLVIKWMLFPARCGLSLSILFFSQYNLHTCRNVESLLAERGEGVKQLTQDTIEFTPEDLIGQTKMQELAKQFSLRQKQDGVDEPKGLVGA